MVEYKKCYKCGINLEPDDFDNHRCFKRVKFKIWKIKKEKERLDGRKYIQDLHYLEEEGLYGGR